MIVEEYYEQLYANKLKDQNKFFAKHKLLIPKLTQEEMNRPITIKGTESEVAQSCPTLSDPMDCSPPGSSVHGIFQARTLEWVAISFSNA